MLRWLVQHGFELGNHTYDHMPLNTLERRGVQKQLALGAEVIQTRRPGLHRTMALPLGALPNATSSRAGAWRGKRYGPYAVLLVGANPSASPYARAFDPARHPAHPQLARRLERRPRLRPQLLAARARAHPEARYVSDGDPKIVSVRAGSEGDVRPSVPSARAHLVK